MPTCLFVLLRHFLRVDGVLFRVRDVRVFHLFGTDKVIREISGWEAEYEAVRAVRSVFFPPQTRCAFWLADRCFPVGMSDVYFRWIKRLPPPLTDLSPLSSSGWVHQTISAVGRRQPAGVKVEDGAKPWPGLGKVTEVWELTKEQDENR